MPDTDLADEEGHETMSHLPWIDAAELRERVPPAAARAAVRDALLAGLDPATDPARTKIPTVHGHLLLMPSVTDTVVGVKVTSVAPGNRARGLERIQGVYVLMDAETLTPQTLLDARAMTSLRTPAVSAAAADVLAPAEARRLVVFGAGPQAAGHVEALREIRDLEEVVVIGRDPERSRALADQVRASGVPARLGEAADVAHADIVVCATSAGEPLFAGDAVAPGACVLAIGSHQPDRRELPADLMTRSLVVVEDQDTALREAGDVVMAAGERALELDELVPLRDVVTGRVARATDRPNVFKGVGMSWQDLVVAATACSR